MPLRTSRVAACRLVALALALAALRAPAAMAQPAAQRPPDDAEVVRALAAGEGRSQPRHRAHHQDAAAGRNRRRRRARGRPGSTGWLGFFRWVDQSARVLVWAAVAALAAWLAFYIVRTVPHVGGHARRRRVRGADTRPGSRHPAREPAGRHRRRGAPAVGPRRAPRGAGAAVPRAAVAPRPRPSVAGARLEHRRRLSGALRAHGRAPATTTPPA